MNPDQQPNQSPRPDAQDLDNVPASDEQTQAPSSSPESTSLDGITPPQPFTPKVEEAENTPSADPVNASPVSPGAPVESAAPVATPMQPTDTSAQPAPAPAKKSPTMLILVIALIVVVLVAAGVAAYVFLQ